MTQKKFSPTWNKSTQPRKQRKYRYGAPLHLKKNFMHSHLSPELRKKHQLRNIQLRTGDRVKILRGTHKKQEGKVETVNIKKERVFITGIEKIKKDGTKLLVPFNPSNLMIVALNLEDKKRKQKLDSKIKSSPSEKGSEKVAETQKEKKTEEKKK
ncbi:50S ribosomal protein L24 [Candidatus Woesearchaeota archaeon]|nr:50S ribosomal protein L24 [Candidatus Woesearchaeota archaeon]